MGRHFGSEKSQVFLVVFSKDFYYRHLIYLFTEFTIISQIVLSLVAVMSSIVL